MLETFTLDTFTPLVNTKFMVGRSEEEGTGLEMELLSAEDIATRPGQEQFSLIFRAPLEPFVQQGMYPVEHERLGSFVLFLVPIAKEEDGYRYEAVFNRARKSTVSTSP